jgi:hypothetical protein
MARTCSSMCSQCTQLNSPQSPIGACDALLGAVALCEREGRIFVPGDRTAGGRPRARGVSRRLSAGEVILEIASRRNCGGLASEHRACKET